ncbi:spermidine/putrescine ABC transporter permease PotC, partial [Acinetobacter baumannii]
EYFLNTLLVAFVSTLAATVLGTLLAVGLVRYRFPGKGSLSYLLYIPVVVPDVVMGVSLLLLFALAREVLGFPRLSLLTVILGHITF